MNIKPNHHILEIGCGTGASVECIAPLLKSGSITAIDKSASMLDKAIKRNQELVNKEKVVFKKTELLKFSSDQSFDKIFCFNINIFWTQKSVEKETAILTKHLKDRGQFYIFYGPLLPNAYKKINEPVIANLEKDGWTVEETVFDKKVNCCGFVAQK
jgi:cyclopropane fatty-acyl-phospholipid synthase-like methyltransferase